MVGSMTPEEQEQLQQTIEMFEVIIQSQPHDYQSLEILKEAYLKLGREQEAVQTSRRIAEAYVELGQLSSAMLEYETILQRFPDHLEVRKALHEIESRAASIGRGDEIEDDEETEAHSGSGDPAGEFTIIGEVDDGEAAMRKLFVDGKHMDTAEFDLCWPENLVADPGDRVIEPFLFHLDDKKIMPIEKSIKLLCDKARVGYLPLGMYDIHIDITRGFPAETCRRWCVLPIDQMSKTILVATTNPFNKRALQELQLSTPNRLLYYVVSPTELLREINKAFR